MFSFKNVKKGGRNLAKNKAFTLVELVIVIAVIAVLSAILVPTFSGIINNSKKAKTDANLKVISTELVTKAYSNGVDYFTLETVKGLAEDLGFDLDSDDLYIPEGYGIWYDQATFNLKLVADTEMFGSADANAELAVFAPEVNYGAGGSVIANLPRRPEAISADKNKLLIASNNEDLMNAIEKVYTLGDSANINDALVEVLGIFADAGIPMAIWSEYQTDFSPETTLYVRSDGTLVGPASNGTTISNVVVSKNATTIEGLFNGTDNVYQYNFDCAIEIPNNIEEIVSTFSNVVSGSVNIVTQNSNLVASDAKISVKVVNTGSNLVDNSIKYDVISLEGGTYALYKDTYVTEYANGFITTTTFTGENIESQIETYLKNEELLNEKHAVISKAYRPRIAFDMTKIREQLKALHSDEGEISITNVTFAERNYGDYRMITILAIYSHTVEKQTDSGTKEETTIYGARLGNGFGYITAVTPSTITSSTVAINEDSTDVTLSVKLPSACLSFENYEELQVEVEYTKKTTYYQSYERFSPEAGVIATSYVKRAEKITEESETITLIREGTSSIWSALVNFDMIDRPADAEDCEYFEVIDSFRNSATITKVTVKNRAGLVLYVQNF